MRMVSAMTSNRRSGVEQPSFVSPDAEVSPDAYIGAFAYIGPGAKIGSRAQIYPQTYVGDGAMVGEDTVLYPGVKVYPGCRIGNRVILHSGVVIGADGFGFAPQPDGSYAKIPQMGNVVVEDDVEIGANTTVDRATMGSTRISHGVKLDNLIQIAHNCEVGHDTVMASQTGIAGSTKVGANCMFGGQVGIAGHIEIGDGVQIAAQSGVPGKVASRRRIMGSPAVDFPRYARLQVYLSKLPDLFKDVELLKKNK